MRSLHVKFSNGFVIIMLQGIFSLKLAGSNAVKHYDLALSALRNAERRSDRHEGEGATCLPLYHQMGDGSTSLFQKLTSES